MRHPHPHTPARRGSLMSSGIEVRLGLAVALSGIVWALILGWALA